MRAFNLLGFDFGASSGRAMLGTLADGKLKMKEVHRFSNDPVMLCGRYVWDVPRLVYEMKQALLKIPRLGITIDAIGIDTWGVDFGLLDKNGHMLGLPVHYRDDRTLGIREKVRDVISDRELFSRTGIAYNQYNSLYQLYAMKQENDPLLDAVADLLFMPDLLAYCLTGSKGTEYTVASTSQMLNPYTRDWDFELLRKLGLPASILGKVELPGKVRGTLRPDIAKECGVGSIPVISIGSHDTASAVAAIPAWESGFAYISSGTWSLLGTELQQPLCTAGVMDANYTNEGAVDGSIRLLTNIMGLWIIQECKRDWDRCGNAVDFAALVEMAMDAPAFQAMIEVDDPCFMAPGSMPSRIQEYCQKTGQSIPKGRGDISRVIYESLALRYRQAIESLERDILGKPIKVLHIVGGGSKNRLLNQFTAEAINRPVITGPGEGTVIGNLLVQAQALGAVGNITELRRVVEKSFPTETYLPNQNVELWDKAYCQYLKLIQRRHGQEKGC